MAEKCHEATQPRRGFTLVELLVVIGIIAVLIGILLPALSAARAAAGAVKCAAQMREVGTTFQMYTMDNRGWMPPARLAGKYNIDGFAYSTGNPAYWQNFVSKYATKLKVGTSVTDETHFAMQQNTVLWGCPNFTPYVATTGLGVVAGVAENVLYTGYGMNMDPMYGQVTPNGSPTGTFEGSPMRNWDPPPAATVQGQWYKQNQYTRPAERVLIADGRYWSLDCRPAPTTGNLPECVVPQFLLNVNLNNGIWSTSAAGNNETTIDIYRHGRYPAAGGGDTFATYGGKISFNLLYNDGHVATCVHGSDAYQGVRMQFPN